MVIAYQGRKYTVNMVPVEMAWKALASMPCCMLWPDSTDADTLFCNLVALRTPTRSSPFAPLKTKNIIIIIIIS